MPLRTAESRGVFFSRGPFPEHFVAVRYNDAVPTWEFDNNGRYIAFTPQPFDTLVATWNFTTDAIEDLQGEDFTVQGVQAGYMAGDLSFTPGNYPLDLSRKRHF